jgi:acyl carrier protein
MTGDTVEQIREIASHIFGVDAAVITTDSSPETVEGWDSERHLNLILAVEQHFDLEFVPEELEVMQDIESIALMVDRKRARVLAHADRL